MFVLFVLNEKMIQNFEIEYVGESFELTDAVFSGPDKPLRLKFIKRDI